MARRRTLLINGEEWQVQLVKSTVRSDGERVRGYCHFDRKVIRVSTTKGQEEARRTLLHEIIHAIHGPVEEHPSDGEGCVSKTERALFPVLADPHNKWVWEMIIG